MDWEPYEASYKGRRKKKYFTHDLKEERVKVDKETEETMVIPSREDSSERFLEAKEQFVEDVVDTAIRSVMPEKSNETLQTLNNADRIIIHALFYQEVIEVEPARRLGIARTTGLSRKHKILEKLKYCCKLFKIYDCRYLCQLLRYILSIK